MTRQGRHSAPNLLHTAEEAQSGPRRLVAGPVPRWALPRCGTLEWQLPHDPRTSTLLACVGFGARAASRVAVAFAPRSGATHQWTEAIPKTDQKTEFLGTPARHGTIAICIAHVLNSSG